MDLAAAAASVGHQYQWLVVVGSIGAFLFGYATGSNDVANAFGTSVGSKALKMWHAVVIASIFEFAGALVLGRVVTSVIAGGVADINAFVRTPEIYAYGMVCALFVGSFWQLLASYMELNVSATHSIIGAIIGFGLVHAGSDGVIWAKKDSNGAFPPYKGVVAIIMSWFVSPILSGAAAALIFFTVRFLVLRRKNAYQLALWTLPPFVCLTIWINTYFILTKGARKMLTTDDKGWTDAKAAWIAAICAGVVTFITAVAIVPLLKWYTNKQFDSDGNRIYRGKDAQQQQPADLEGGAEADPKLAKEGVDAALPAAAAAEPAQATFMGKAKKAALHGLTFDIHKIIDEDESIYRLHEHAEVFEPRIEYSFSYLQIFSACCVIFAHGAGEVGYMAGPLATIWDVYKKGFLSKDTKAPFWITLIGAFGLVFGLATYGYKVTRAMGVRLAKISPTRGFAAELATALIITIAAQYGLPTSSSQCITGAIIGVGLLEGVAGVNWRQFARQFASWVATLAVVGLLTAALFAQGVYAPSEIDGKFVLQYENRLANSTVTVLKDMNTTVNAYKAAANASALTRITGPQLASLQTNINKLAATASDMVNPKKTQSVDPAMLLTAFNKALTLAANYSVNTLGQNSIFAGANQCTSNSTDAIAANELAVCKGLTLVSSAYKTSFP